MISERTVLREQIASATAAQNTAVTVFAGHKQDWVHVLNDGAGDGYFFDPHRTDTEGAFFFNFAEDGYYVWFPSFRNFLAGLIECYESGCIKLAADGKSLEEDFDRTREIWDQFAKSNVSSN